jgi:hypothetical protein
MLYINDPAKETWLYLSVFLKAFKAMTRSRKPPQMKSIRWLENRRNLEARRQQHERDQRDRHAKHPALATSRIGSAQHGNQDCLQEIGCAVVRLGRIGPARQDDAAMAARSPVIMYE